MNKPTTVSRKIKFYPIDQEGKEVLFDFIHKGRKLLNRCYSHNAIISQLDYMSYLRDKEEGKNVIQDLLKTSKNNLGYELSKEDMSLPSYIRSSCAKKANDDFKNDKKEINSGERSIRNYRKYCGIPCIGTGLRIISKDKKNFDFLLCGIMCRTVLGRDGNNNEIMLDRILNKKYKQKDFTIKYDERSKNWFLIISIEIIGDKVKLDIENSIDVSLGLDSIIEIEYGGKSHMK